jgi:hypothetical protein
VHTPQWSCQPLPQFAVVAHQYLGRARAFKLVLRFNLFRFVRSVFGFISVGIHQEEFAVGLRKQEKEHLVDGAEDEAL